MKVIKYGRWLLAFAMLAVGTVGHASGSAAPYPYTASGVGDPSWPLFLGTNETIKVTKTGSGSNAYWTLTGTGSNSTLFGSLTNSYNLGSESVKYVANFNSAGKLITSMGSTTLTNYLEIKGSLPAGTIGGTSWGALPANTLLLKANLLDTVPGNGTPDLVGTWGGVAVGFKTLFTGGWASTYGGLDGGSIGENLWLAGLSNGFFDLVKALDGNSGNGTLSSLFGSTKTINGVVSVASVPLPAAFWLFGTGLMSLLAGRRKSTAASRLAA
jgi:hypothetical protein